MAANTPWLVKNRARNRNHDPEWSFSCRKTPYNAYCGSDSDSDSDSSLEDNNGGPRPSEEALLLSELDLASREETVQYKPNPFSIAKINAAFRRHPSKETESNISPRKLRPSGKPVATQIGRNKDKKIDGKIRPNTSIIDGLKNQSKKQKATLASKKVIPLPSFRFTVPLKPSIGISNPSDSKSLTLLVPSLVKVPTPPHGAGSNNATSCGLQRASDIPIQTHISTSEDATCALSLSSLPDSSPTAHITSCVDGSVNKLTHMFSSAPSHEDFSSNFLEDDSVATIRDGTTEIRVDTEHSTFPKASRNLDLGATLIDTEISVSNAPVPTRPHNHSEGPLLPLRRSRNFHSSPLNKHGARAIQSTSNSINLTPTIDDDPHTRPRPLSFSSPLQQPYTTIHTRTASRRFGVAALSSPFRPADRLTSDFRDVSRMPITPTDTSLASPCSHKPLGRRCQNSHEQITISKDILSPNFTNHDDLEQFAVSRVRAQNLIILISSSFRCSLQVGQPHDSRSSSPLREITPRREIKHLQLGRVPSNDSELGKILFDLLVLIAVLTSRGSGDCINSLGYNVKVEDTTLHPENTKSRLSHGLITPTGDLFDRHISHLPIDYFS